MAAARLARQAHAALNRFGSRTVRQPEAVFLGDSITLAWMREDPAFFGRTRLNRGINGETTREMRARFEADVIAPAPRLVHIMAGTNDLWHGDPGPNGATALANLRAMTAQARAAGIRVILAAPPPIAAYALEMFRTPQLFGTLVDGIRTQAEDEGLTYVNYATSLCDADGQLRPVYTTDGVHLTRAGYLAMRDHAAAALAKALS